MQQCMTYSSRSPPLMGKRGHNNVDSPGPADRFRVSKHRSRRWEFAEPIAFLTPWFHSATGDDRRSNSWNMHTTSAGWTQRAQVCGREASSRMVPSWSHLR